jgi:ectoine hydroxylase
MTLTRQQLQQFDREGYLFLPDLFSAEEIGVLRREAEAIFRTERKEIWREKTGSPRTAFAAHTYNEAFRLLGEHPRLIRPVEQVFGEALYMHQFRSTRNRRSMARCGSGTRTTAPGRGTTACPSRGR